MPFSIGAGLDTLRDNLYIRILRALQFLFAVVVLGVSAASAADWHDLSCGIPGKVAYNIAASVITILILIYLIASTGKPRLNFLPWHHFVQLGIDAFLLIIWIASTATAALSCSDICSACSSAGTYVDDGCGFNVFYGGTACFCYFAYDTGYCPYDKHKRMVLDARNVFEKRAAGRAGVTGAFFKGIKNGSKIGVNVIELILCLVALGATIYFIFMSRRQTTHGHAATATTSAPTMAPTTHVVEEPKVEPVHAAAYPPQNPNYTEQSPEQSFAPPPLASYEERDPHHGHHGHHPPQNTYPSPQHEHTAVESTNPVSPINYENNSSYQSEYTHHTNETHHGGTHTHDTSVSPPSYSSPTDQNISSAY